MQNSMAILTFSFFDWRNPFWASFVQKLKIGFFKIKFDTCTISSMKNSVVNSLAMFLIGSILFGENYFKKSKLFGKAKIWNLKKIKYVKCDCDFLFLFFFFFFLKYHFWVNLVQKFKIIALS